jgi:hypothetical protein
MFVPDDATAVFAFDRANFPLATIGRDLSVDRDPCWPKLEASVKRAYQVMSTVGPGQFRSHFVFELSPFDRAATEDCLQTVFRKAAKRDGDRTVLDVEILGAAHLLWREPFVVVGNDDDLARATGKNPIDGVWRKRIDGMSRTAMVHGVTDSPLFDTMLRLSTTLTELKFESELDMRLRVHYGNAADAETAAKRFSAADLDFVGMPEQLRKHIAKLVTEVKGSILEIHIDPVLLASFETDAATKEWFAQVQAQAEQLKAAQKKR